RAPAAGSGGAAAGSGGAAAGSSGAAEVAASAARLAATACDQQVGELLLQALEGRAMEAGRDAPVSGAAEEHWRYAQAATIASGTAEVQRMVVARHLLGDRR
ncbi:MAG TPA: acyl-CoA dehydrogenase family protein, partial [Acidimicrobiales bacterium]|nr:acyl-CoA dehydrogenase family protein [Acidimicrobiales bacterium]